MNGISYLNARQINEQTKKYFNLEIITNDEGDFIKIPYSEGFKLRICKKTKDNKYIDKVEKLEIYNLKNANINEPLYITIGEFNVMILHQLGYKNSIAFDKPENTKKLVKENYELLSKFKKIIVVAPNNNNGQKFANGMKTVFKNSVLCDRKNLKSFVDINELYILGENHCHKLLRSYFQSEADFINISDINISELYEFGRERGSFGIDWLNKKMNGLERGRVYGITGPTCGGKSVLVNQIILATISKGHIEMNAEEKILICDGEETAEDRLYNLYFPLISSIKDFKKNQHLYVDEVIDGYCKKQFIKPELNKKIQLWHKNQLFLYSSSYDEKKIETDLLFENIKRFVEFGGITTVVIDNIMSLNNDSTKESMEAQHNFILKCQSLAKLYNVAVVVCMHLRKFANIDDVTFQDVSGNGNITSLLDGLILVYRATEEEKNEKQIDGHMKILKNRSMGTFGSCKVKFENKSFIEYEPISNTFIKIENNEINNFINVEEPKFYSDLEEMEQQILNMDKLYKKG